MLDRKAHIFLRYEAKQYSTLLSCMKGLLSTMNYHFQLIFYLEYNSLKPGYEVQNGKCIENFLNKVWNTEVIFVFHT